MHRERIDGLIAAPPTPMNAEGGVDLARVPQLARFLARNGVVGAFVAGTTGESLSLTMAERMALAEAWRREARDGFKIILHVGHNSIEDCKTLAQHARDLGVWAVAAMPPVFFRPATLDALVDFCAELAAAAPSLPFYYYHIPSMTGVRFAMIDFFRAAAESIPNLAGMKFTCEDLMDYRLCLDFQAGRFEMLFGRDEMLLGALALGAKGAVGTTYNLAAPLYRGIIDAFRGGDLATAGGLQSKAAQMVETLEKADPTLLAAVKSAMKMIGMDCGAPRKPLPTLSADREADLRRRLDEIGGFSCCCRVD